MEQHEINPDRLTLLYDDPFSADLVKAVDCEGGGVLSPLHTPTSTRPPERPARRVGLRTAGNLREFGIHAGEHTLDGGTKRRDRSDRNDDNQREHDRVLCGRGAVFGLEKVLGTIHKLFHLTPPYMETGTLRYQPKNMQRVAPTEHSAAGPPYAMTRTS